MCLRRGLRLELVERWPAQRKKSPREVEGNKDVSKASIVGGEQLREFLDARSHQTIETSTGGENMKHGKKLGRKKAHESLENRLD